MTSRKELIRAYKENPRPMGVYRIENRHNGKILIGAALDPRARLNRHQALLRMGVHPNKSLQGDWREHGERSFVFEVIDTLEPAKEPVQDPREELELLEDMWLERLQPYGLGGYNEPGKRV